MASAGSSTLENGVTKAARLATKGCEAFEAYRHAEAISFLGQAIYLRPNEPSLYGLRAEAHIQMCDLQSGLANLRKALKLAADLEEKLSAAGKAKPDADDAGPWAEASEALQATMQSAIGAVSMPSPTGGAARAAAEAARHAARLARVLDLRAVTLIEDGAHADAAPLLTEALALDESVRALWLHRALARTGLEQYEDALSDLTKCIALDGNDADIHFLRAKLSLLAGSLEGARRAVDTALRLRPHHADALELQKTMSDCADVYTDEATKLILVGSPADAVSNLTHAMALRPDDPSLLMRRGAARRQQGQLLEAARDLEGAIRLAGGRHPECQRLLVLTFNDLGVKLASTRKFSDALGWLHRAVALDETLGPVFLNRGDCHRALGDIDAALTDFERAAVLFVGDAKAQWAIQSRIAVVHNERGAQMFNHAAARHAAVEFSRAIECNPRVASFYVNRAQATLELKRYDLAKDDVLAALQINPHDEKAKQLLHSLCPGML